MLLENGKIKLRQLEPEDLELLYRWENDPTLWAVGNTRQRYSRYTLKQYILQGDKDIFETHQLRLMIECKETRQTVGTVDLFDFDVFHSRVALGLFVDTQYQGKGYAIEAVKAFINWINDNYNVKIEALVDYQNLSSIKLLQKTGFQFQTANNDELVFELPQKPFLNKDMIAGLADFATKEVTG